MSGLLRVYKALLAEYGPQGWWPAGGRYFPPRPKTSPELAARRFEIILGAVLTQNTAWANADRALGNLREAGLLDPEAILGANTGELARLVHPSGYYNQKSARIKLASGFFLPFLKAGRPPSRELLLQVKGVGPETADSILLYAYGEPFFVVDAYTRRLLLRRGLTGAKASYHEIQALFHEALPRDEKLFNEYHALIVRHAKERCAKVPLCAGCALKRKRLCFVF